ncbi:MULTISPECIES: AICARFT/IMPCHase bienzyme [Desulfococcus]|jgi:phosphoribosylaminoimidazolecarboxamide formyltransferase/IMP cyclohydrolase|uniref:AICARFT/IMPCHase bienzyme n=1 Tax=Desulfococcus multivorans DSM 2059 TaxID=1121405 RepID=S7UUV2_DESML|nr:AICARFT/IMPCHase bienzyme [Desulfococcus multivorans]AOY59648.1 PurH2: phosphoribosylaminoimidazolecarboxamide formyltransferase [Desulfococcus multivorans]AQV01835.1 IMP cyclohydrolase [Desulfococcus multivorans]EPR37864.1 AICARFT/IMPCHase bienzyme [Desulfococcus multivorans DSM 2059]SKA16438.1 phosphoribosylaminoimidazolecarboxamide formyltransferase / IMP cyclohydrolase [Desulfococcus multivorans DSM 2059]
MTENLKKMYQTINEDHFPPEMEISFIEGTERQTLFYEKVTWAIDGVQKGLRYGENPGQEAALYRLVNGNLMLGDIETLLPGQYLASDIELLQSGKHPGKTNLTDTDNALNILRYFDDKPTAVIVKHNNPCGAARADTLSNAYHRAYMADRVAAFGGCIALNRSVDKTTAEAVSDQYAEVVVAPDFEEGVLDILGRRKNLRVIRIGNIARLKNFIGKRFVEFKSLIDGGHIVQWSFVPTARTPTDLKLAECEYQGKTYRVRREPTSREYEDMLFGWLVESGITSNSVIYVKDLVTVGIGTGEQDRVGVAEIARDKAYRKLADRYCFEAHGIPYKELTDPDRRAAIDARVAEERGGLTGAAMVSDAFFPFRDGIDVGIQEGVTAVIQPGGSSNDYQSIEACNAAGVTMVYTGQRSFKH